MKTILFIRGFNNYNNRKIKIASTKSEFESQAHAVFQQSCNFNPNDGIQTTITVGGPDMLDFETKGECDYLAVFSGNTSYSQNLVSRWFVMETIRLRDGQFKMILRRDVMADYFEGIRKAPIYVEKAVIDDAQSPLLFNNEGLKVNQVKKDEILLKDKSECPWLVMYIAKDVIGSNDSNINTVVVPDSGNMQIRETLATPITQWDYYQYINNSLLIFKDFTYCTWFKNQAVYSEYQVNNRGSNVRVNVSSNTNLYKNGMTTDVIKENLDAQYTDAAINTLNIATNTSLEARGFKTENDLNDLMFYNDGIVCDSLGNYYKIHVREVNRSNVNEQITSSTYSTVFTTMTNKWNSATNQSQTPNNQALLLRANGVYYRVDITQVSYDGLKVDFTSSTGHTKDSALFDVICLPYADIRMDIGGAVPPIQYHYSKDECLATMNAIATQLTSQRVYDLQLLPYCPIQNALWIQNSNVPTILNDSTQYINCYKNGNVYNPIPIVPYTQITFDIDKNIELPRDDTHNFSEQLKYMNDCTLLRLCSPNFNGTFDFNIGKNGGSIEGFNVDITLKPVSPYIHVNPFFKGLYGRDFNDCRGLICGGDFSLGIINSKWNEYEIQNKNYQNIFDRQIQHMDVENDIRRQEAAWGLGAGALQGGAAGAATGAFIGGPVGAAIGGAAGLVTSAAGGALDYANMEKRMAEQKDYAIDNFNMSLQNIKALPYSITRTNAQTYNNKLFPVIEVYECTEVEKEAYYNKLKYDGMTIGVIGKMDDFAPGFFKGQLIRLESFPGDSHLLDEIKIELYKGVYK